MAVSDSGKSSEGMSRDKGGTTDGGGADVSTLKSENNQEARRTQNTASNESRQATRDPKNAEDKLRRWRGSLKRGTGSIPTPSETPRAGAPHFTRLVPGTVMPLLASSSSERLSGRRSFSREQSSSAPEFVEKSNGGARGEIREELGQELETDSWAVGVASQSVGNVEGLECRYTEMITASEDAGYVDNRTGGLAKPDERSGGEARLRIWGGCWVSTVIDAGRRVRGEGGSIGGRGADVSLSKSENSQETSRAQITASIASGRVARDLESARDGPGRWQRFLGTIESYRVARAGGLEDGLLSAALYLIRLIPGIVVLLLGSGSCELSFGSCFFTSKGSPVLYRVRLVPPLPSTITTLVELSPLSSGTIVVSR